MKSLVATGGITQLYRGNSYSFFIILSFCLQGYGWRLTRQALAIFLLDKVLLFSVLINVYSIFYLFRYSIRKLLMLFLNSLLVYC
jgi:hypothetical protein